MPFDVANGAVHVCGKSSLAQWGICSAFWKLHLWEDGSIVQCGECWLLLCVRSTAMCNRGVRGYYVMRITCQFNQLPCLFFYRVANQPR